MYSGGKGSSGVGWSLQRMGREKTLRGQEHCPGPPGQACSGAVWGTQQPCHLPVIWAPDGASGLHEVESVGLARTVREIPLALVHHFSMDQDEGPWQGHSRSGEHLGQEGTWWAVPSLKRWCGFFVPLLIPGTSGAWSLPPVGSCAVGRGFRRDQVLPPWPASLGSGIAFCGISRTRQKPAGASPGNTALELSFPFLKERVWDFPGSPVVKTPSFRDREPRVLTRRPPRNC